MANWWILFLDASILGLAVAYLERERFPGWVPTICSILAMLLATLTVMHVLPDSLSLFGFLAGAAFGAFVLSWLCKITFGRGLMAVGVYVGVKVILWAAGALLWRV